MLGTPNEPLVSCQDPLLTDARSMGLGMRQEPRRYSTSDKYKIMFGPWNHSDPSVTGYRFQYCKSGLPLV